ncbi:MAG: hypothetical protein U5L01_07465 [Rheinheimera sp.]|nr:hypothetical protein [Rheinheimera sp.]
MAKHDGDGNETWIHEFSATDLEIDEEDYSGPFVFPRGGVFELSDSCFIVFGSVGNDLDCYAFKFDSLGNYIDHVSWGHPTYSDGSAWPMQISENEPSVSFMAHIPMAWVKNGFHIPDWEF